jgi:hypothetical protein
LNDSAASLGIMPLLGKWERQAEQFLHVNFGTAHAPVRGGVKQEKPSYTTWKVMSQISDALKHFSCEIKGL